MTKRFISITFYFHISKEIFYKDITSLFFVLLELYLLPKNVRMYSFHRFTWYCTHFLKIGFVVAGGGFYSYYNHQGNKLDKERKIFRIKLSFTFMHTKRFNTFFKRWVQFRVVQFHVYPFHLINLDSKNPSIFGLISRIFGLIRIRAKNPRIDNPG